MKTMIRNWWNFKGLRVLIAGLVIIAITFTLGFQGGAGVALTKWVQVFGNKTTVGVSTPFQDIGQSSHWVTYCSTGGGTLTIYLEGSHDQITWFPISVPGTQVSGCGIIEAGGYFPGVRVNITVNTTSGVNVWYTASAAPIAGGGLTQLGKTTVPVAPNFATSTLEAPVKSGVTTINFGVPTPTLIYEVVADNTANAAVSFCRIADSGGTFGFQVDVPAAQSKVIAFPAGGTQALNTLTGACSTSATSSVDPTNFVKFTTFYSVGTSVPVSVNNSGTGSGSARIR